MWSCLDVHVGVIVVCLPSLRPLLRHNMQGSTDDYKYGSNSNTHLTRLTAISAIRREQGFEVIVEEGRGVNMAGAPQGLGRHHHHHHEWNDGKLKGDGSGSDIELVTVSAPVKSRY